MTTATIRQSSGPPTGAAVVHLPALHAPFDVMDDSEATRQVIVVGRQAGKTTYAARKAVKAMGKGQRVLYAAPTADQTDAFWECVLRWTAKAREARIMRCLETKRLITFPATRGRIRAKTAWNADTLRGDNADLLILDEYSIMDPDAWRQVGAPMMLRYNGTAVFIFTPKKKNHAHAMYVQALQGEAGRWGVWHAPSHVNPHLSTDALATMVEDMTEDDYRQEILAEFLENDGAVFRNVAACLVPARAIMPGLWRGEDEPDAHDGHRVVIGVDWGKVGDYTAVSVVCATCAREVELFRGRGDDYAVQRQRLADQCARWRVSSGKAESNSMGGPILEMLRRGESGEKVERDTSLAGYVEVELHSTSPAAVSAVRAAMVALPGINTEPFIDKAGRYYVPAGFAADAAVRQGYVAGTVAATEDEAEDAAPGYKPLPIRGFETTAASKPPLIENLALSLERAEVKWLDVPVATAELEAYERKSSAATGRASYSAPAGVHDDTVIARALARKEAGRLGTMATTRLWA